MRWISWVVLWQVAGRIGEGKEAGADADAAPEVPAAKPKPKAMPRVGGPADVAAQAAKTVKAAVGKAAAKATTLGKGGAPKPMGKGGAAPKPMGMGKGKVAPKAKLDPSKLKIEVKNLTAAPKLTPKPKPAPKPKINLAPKVDLTNFNVTAAISAGQSKLAADVKRNLAGIKDKPAKPAGLWPSAKPAAKGKGGLPGKLGAGIPKVPDLKKLKASLASKALPAYKGRKPSITLPPNFTFPMGATWIEFREKQFAVLDADKDGWVSAEELGDMHRQLSGKDKQALEKEDRSLLAASSVKLDKLDKDRDGKIDLDEWLNKKKRIDL